MKVHQSSAWRSAIAAQEIRPTIKLSALSIMKVGIGSLGFMAVSLILSLLR